MGGLALTAGCLDFVRGEGPLEFAAERVAPSQAALDETGYEEDTVEEETIEETVDVGVEREVRATVHISTYTNELEFEGELRDASTFAAISMPDMEFAGRSFNPVEDMSHEELLEEFADQMDGEHGDVDDLEHEESFTLDVLGGGRDTDVFVGQTEFEGERIDVEVVVTSFGHEDDIIVLLGSYPVELADESANVEELMESVEHPA